MRALLPMILLTLAALTALATAQDEPPLERRAEKGDGAEKGERVESGIAALDFLAGRWTGTSDDGKTWETVYTTPTGGEILSASKEMRDGKVAMFEFERFVEREGTVYVVPHPFGKAKEPFKLKSLDAKKRVVVFEDPENDFPRTLTYARPAVDELVIGVAGEMWGEPVNLTIRLKRVAD